MPVSYTHLDVYKRQVQGRMINNAETCFAEIYLEVAKVNSGKITWRIVNESDTWRRDLYLRSPLPP